jgi:uncharacterized protein YcbK (DUF882 family)
MIESEVFKREEFACKCGCGFDVVDAELLDVLESIRYHFDTPVIITSGCRCREHNIAEGGSEGSQHTLGKAADIVVRGVDPSLVYEYFDSRFPNRGGAGMYKDRTHVDVRDEKARWDER